MFYYKNEMTNKFNLLINDGAWHAAVGVWCAYAFALCVRVCVCACVCVSLASSIVVRLVM